MKSLYMCLIVLACPLETAYAADQIIRLDECSFLGESDFHELASFAFSKRGYNIEEETPSMIVGENDSLRVEILIEDGNRMVIRWKEGFGHRRDTWLRNLKTDILWRLAE